MVHLVSMLLNVFDAVREFECYFDEDLEEVRVSIR